MTVTKPLGTWHGKMPDSIANPSFFTDPSRSISEQLSRDARREMLAGNEPTIRAFLKVHRIGLMNGIGFEIPYGEASDFINYVQIVAEYETGRLWRGNCTMRFCKATLHEDHMFPPEIEVVRTRQRVPLEVLTKVFAEET